MTTQQRLVVVGGSLAGVRAVESARDAGFTGEITLVGAEPHPPYDRPSLSKDHLVSEAEPEHPALLSPDNIDDLRVNLLLGESATALDTDRRIVEIGNRELPYDRLVIATGARARRLTGTEDLDGIHTLRTVDDAGAVRRALTTARHVVVVGGGFIGSEIASSARARGCQVTIVEARSAPLAQAVGAAMGRACAELHTRHGTVLKCGVTVTFCEGQQAVERVRLSDGSTLNADLVVVGLGAEPVTDWLAGSGVDVDDGVRCDTTLATSAAGVFAAGDVARWHNDWCGEDMRLEHWTTAAEQGGIAGRNAVVDHPRSYGAIPYFWSDWYGSRIQFFGLSDHDETRVVRGAPDVGGFVTLYRNGDRLVGALAVDERIEIMKYRRLLRQSATWGDALAFADSRKKGRTSGASSDRADNKSRARAGES